MAAREVVTMLHAASGRTQRASRAAYEAVWADEGWKVVASEEFVPEVVEKPVDKMTVAELKAYAEKLEIDLGTATSKPDILAVVQAHLAAPPVQDPPADPEDD
jgi:hypothetical protein